MAIGVFGQVMQEDQKLMLDFQNYGSVLVRMLNNCIKEPHSHLAVFVMQHDINARLDFIQVSSLFIPFCHVITQFWSRAIGRSFKVFVTN